MVYRNILLVLHIGAAGAWLGANLLQAIVPGILGPVSPAAANWFRATEKLSRRFYIPAGVTVLVTGVLLVLNSEVFGFGTLFVTIGFAAVIIGAVLGSAVFGPKSLAIAEAIEAGEPDKANKVRANTGQWGAFDTLVLVFTIYAMVAKLGV
ncbi:MAG: hypothetical protein DWQ40_12640 [Actinobacteria bacterium]|nr:MAG: hypothetical protein DWQ40_12640 [Actinomycetota bacterium]